MYKDSYYKDMAVNVKTRTGKTTALYWDDPYGIRNHTIGLIVIKCPVNYFSVCSYNFNFVIWNSFCSIFS